MLDFIENGNVLEIRVADKEEFEYILAERDRQEESDHWAWLRALDEGLERDYQYETYTLLRPEQVGALTDSQLIAKNVEWDEEREEVLSTEWIAWFPEYMIVSELDELIKNGVVKFTIERD